MDSELENKLTRCPRLGHEITLSYCLREAVDLPCARIMACWSSVFDVATYLQNELPKEAWLKFTGIQPKEKLVSIIELIEAAKANK